jgi:hypothetical protein
LRRSCQSPAPWLQDIYPEVAVTLKRPRDFLVAPSDNPLRRVGLEAKFVVGYSGNLGFAHEFTTMLAAAERLNGNSDIALIYVGGGHLLNQLAQCIQERGIATQYDKLAENIPCILSSLHLVIWARTPPSRLGPPGERREIMVL